jgi:hypothetical protein
MYILRTGTYIIKSSASIYLSIQNHHILPEDIIKSSAEHPESSLTCKLHADSQLPMSCPFLFQKLLSSSGFHMIRSTTTGPNIVEVKRQISLRTLEVSLSPLLLACSFHLLCLLSCISHVSRRSNTHSSQVSSHA